MTEDQLANALYGSITEHDVEPPRQQAQQQQPADSDELARRMYRMDHPDGHVGEDGYDRIYASTERSIETAMLERAGFDPADARAEAANWATTYRTHGIEANEAQTLTEIGLGVILGGVEPDPVAWRAQARQDLVSEVGAQNVEAAIQAAREMVGKDQRLMNLLESTGLGDHPRVVVALAGKAWRNQA